MDFLTLPTFAADTFTVTFYPADGNLTNVESCVSSAAFIQSQILPIYAVETVIEKNVSLPVAAYVAGVTSITPYVSLYGSAVTSYSDSTSTSTSSSSTSSTTTIVNDSGRRLQCTSCSCRCADNKSVAKLVYGCNCYRRRRLGEKSLSVVAKDVLDNTESEDKGRGLQSVGHKFNIIPGDGMYTAKQFYRAVERLSLKDRCRPILASLLYEVLPLPVEGLFN